MDRKDRIAGKRTESIVGDREKKDCIARNRKKD